MNSRSKGTKPRKIVRVFLIMLALMIVAVGIYVGYLYKKAENVLEHIAISPSFQAAQASNENIEDHTVDKPILFLLAGLDSRDGGDGMMNTDVLMLVSFNPRTTSASVLSLPRDLLLIPQAMPARKANYYYAHHYIKNKAEAIPNTKKLFSDTLDLPIDYMVVINFELLIELVDLLGGLDIDVDMDMKYIDTVDGTNINLKKGLQKLDGAQVLDFVRYRKSNRGTNASSDFERNDRQQLVMNQIVDKLGSFQGISQLGKLLDIIGKNVESDIPADLIKEWVHHFPKMKPNQIHSLKVESVWKNPYVYMKKEELEEAIRSIQRELEMESSHAFSLDGVGVID